MSCFEGEDFFLAKSQLAGLSWGPRDAPTWLALHGWLDNAATFSRIGPALARQLGVRIVALDFSGHGHSAHRPVRAEYSIWSYCHDVLDALEELNLRKVTLMGHSLGAGVVNILSSAWPEIVQGIILIDGLLGRLSLEADIAKQLRQGITAQRRVTSSSMTYKHVEQAVAMRVRKSILPIDADTVRPIVMRNLISAGQAGYRLRIDKQVMAARPVSFTEAQATAILSGVQSPALLIQGRQGIIPARDPNHACRQAINGLAQVTLEGGHHLHLEPSSVELAALAIAQWANQHPQLSNKQDVF